MLKIALKPNLKLWTLVLFIGSVKVFSQSEKIDSLKDIIQQGAQDTTMVSRLTELSSELLNEEDIGASQAYALKAVDLADKLNYRKGKAYALKSLGMSYYYQGNYLNVLDYWTQSLTEFESIRDSLGIANMTSNLGAVYFSQGSNIKAIDYYLQSLKISEKIKDTLRVATALVNIGGVYGDTPRDYDKALSYYMQIEPHLITLNNPRISIAYLFGVGEIYYKQARYKEALEYYEKALPISENTAMYAENLTKLGEVEFKIGDIKNALNFLQLSLQSAKENDQQLQVVKTLIALGNVYEKTDLSEALKAYKQAERIATKIDTDFELRDIYRGISQTYEAKGDFTNAFKYQTKYIAQKDSLFNLETNDKIRGIQFDFDLEKKQDQIGLLEKESQIAQLQAKRQQYVIYAAGISLVMVFLLALGAFSRYRFIKRTNRIIEDEKNRSENLLLNILPEETALELKQKGRVEAKRFESVTVLFTDFKGFTKYAENLPPEDLVKSVDFYFSRFDSIMETYGLEKIKTVGDAYMCAGGLPFPSDDHAVRTILAGIEIAKFVETTKIAAKENQVSFEVRIGINTGPVVAGIVGTKKFAYDIWGDAVNVASRMETASEPGRINISDNTYHLVKDFFDCEYRGKIEVKNRGLMNMYFVNGCIDNETINKILDQIEA